MKQYLDDITNGVNVKPEPKDHNYIVWLGLLGVLCFLFGLLAGLCIWFACGVVEHVYLEGVRDGKNL
jgi:hypothetical protein